MLHEFNCLISANSFLPQIVHPWIVSGANIQFMNQKIAIMRKLYDNFHIFHFQKRIVSSKTIRGNTILYSIQTRSCCFHLSNRGQVSIIKHYIKEFLTSQTSRGVLEMVLKYTQMGPMSFYILILTSILLQYLANFHSSIIE